MELTRLSFNRSAKLLTKALEISTEEQQNDEDFRLCHWKLECTDHGDPYAVYLIHPPVDGITDTTFGNVDLGPNDEADVQNEILLEDKTVSDDTQLVMTADRTGDRVVATTLWTFSIVYSSVYRVPVLYFHVQNLNGTPCGRQDVLKMLRKIRPASIGEFPKEKWEFVSQEEHPFSGFPSYFLHPCQSSQLLQLMINSTAVSGSISEGYDVPPEGASSQSMLWAWMSMILPVVGHSVPASYYLKIQRAMDELSRTEKIITVDDTESLSR